MGCGLIGNWRKMGMNVGKYRFLVFLGREKLFFENFCDFLGTWMLTSVLTEDSKKGQKRTIKKKKKKKKKRKELVVRGIGCAVHDWL